MTCVQIKLRYFFTSSVPWFLIALLVIFTIYCVQPVLKCGYRTSRYQLLITLKEILISPFGRVRFRDFFFADVITSMGGTLQDIGFSIYFCYTADIERDKSLSLEVKWLHIFSIVCGFIPYWFRFWQCINKYHNTRVKAHLLNAGKYSSKLIPPLVTTIYTKAKSQGDGFALYLVF